MPRTVSRADYYAYIQSPAWAEVKRRYLASKLPKCCDACKTPYGPGFHFHHRTYKNLGAERLMDIVPVCQPCHWKIHEEYKKNPRDGLWRATTKVRSRHARKARKKERKIANGKRRAAIELRKQQQRRLSDDGTSSH